MDGGTVVLEVGKKGSLPRFYNALLKAMGAKEVVKKFEADDVYGAHSANAHRWAMAQLDREQDPDGDVTYSDFCTVLQTVYDTDQQNPDENADTYRDLCEELQVKFDADGEIGDPELVEQLIAMGLEDVPLTSAQPAPATVAAD